MEGSLRLGVGHILAETHEGAEEGPDDDARKHEAEYPRPCREPRETEGGDEGEKSEEKGQRDHPVCDKESMMASTPPKEAPADTPAISGLTRGLRKTPCMAAPERARPMPQRTTVKIRGRRTISTTTR